MSSGIRATVTFDSPAGCSVARFAQATGADVDSVSTSVAPAERHTVEFTANADPGIYLMHCHKVNHAMNGNFYPGGMVSGVVYKEAMDTDIFAQLMDYAGYGG